MNQMDTVIEILSERRAGSKLKCITKTPCPKRENHSLITFFFEGDENEECHIGIYGEDLSVSFGRKSI